MFIICFIICIFLSFSFAVYAYFPKGFYLAPNPTDLLNELHGKTHYQLLDWVNKQIKETLDGYDNGHEEGTTKSCNEIARCIKWSLRFLWVSIFFLYLYILNVIFMSM